MIDIHSHLIPNIDDGARDKAEALSLLRMAAEEGVERMVLTPHFYIGRFDNSKLAIFESFFELKLEAAKQGIPIELAVAAEVRIDAELLYLFKKGLIPFIGTVNNNKVVLLELPHSHFPPGADNLIKWMVKHNIIPLIAHPERNRDIQKHPDLAIKLKRLGCLLQVTSASIVGDFGARAQDLSEYLLVNKLVDVVASDAHSVKRRPPKLREAYNKVASEFAPEYAEELFCITPKKLTESLFI